MLLQRWKPIFFGAAFQYVHGIFTQLASRMHVPQEVPLPDLGFSILPVRPGQFMHLTLIAASTKEPMGPCSRVIITCEVALLAASTKN